MVSVSVSKYRRSQKYRYRVSIYRYYRSILSICIAVPGNGAHTELQEDLHNLHCWSIQNCLLFNYKKCSITAFTFRKSANLIDITLGGNVKKHRKEIKDLGRLVIKDNLNWSDHAKNRISKAGTRRFGNKMAEDVSATKCCRNVFHLL